MNFSYLLRKIQSSPYSIFDNKDLINYYTDSEIQTLVEKKILKQIPIPSSYSCFQHKNCVVYYTTTGEMVVSYCDQDKKKKMSSKQGYLFFEADKVNLLNEINICNGIDSKVTIIDNLKFKLYNYEYNNTGFAIYYTFGNPDELSILGLKLLEQERIALIINFKNNYTQITLNRFKSFGILVLDFVTINISEFKKKIWENNKDLLNFRKDVINFLSLPDNSSYKKIFTDLTIVNNINYYANNALNDDLEDSVYLHFSSYFSTIYLLGKNYRGVEVPDGIINFDDYSVMYDCKSHKEKNKFNFDTDERRQFNSYFTKLEPQLKIKISKLIVITGDFSQEKLVKVRLEQDWKKLSHDREILIIKAITLEQFYKLIQIYKQEMRLRFNEENFKRFLFERDYSADTNLIFDSHNIREITFDELEFAFVRTLLEGFKDHVMNDKVDFNLIGSANSKKDPSLLSPMEKQVFIFLKNNSSIIELMKITFLSKYNLKTYLKIFDYFKRAQITKNISENLEKVNQQLNQNKKKK